MFALSELRAAQALIHQSFPGTAQYAWPLLAARAGAEVWVKHENHTPTGAFKLRGGLVYAERLARERPEVRWHRFGDAGQSRAVAGLCRAALWRAGDGGGAARQQRGEERGDARAGRAG